MSLIHLRQQQSSIYNLALMLGISAIVLGSTAARAATEAELVKGYCGELGGVAFDARTTAYYPANSKMEGGFTDRRGRKLRTLQAHLRGDVNYVSIAMDRKAFKYGTKVMIPTLSDSMGSKEQIPFRVVDTGGAFRGKGRSRVDICVENHGESLRKEFNRKYTMIVCNGQDLKNLKLKQ